MGAYNKLFDQLCLGDRFEWGEKTWYKTEVVFVNCCTKRNAVNTENDGDIRYFQDDEMVEYDNS
jgi:hypothetical protein